MVAFSPAASLPLSPLIVLRLRLRQWFIRRRVSPARRGRYQPLAGNVTRGDLFAESWILHGAGFHTAAACSARCAVERRVRGLMVLTRDGERVACHSIEDAANRLYHAGCINYHQHREIINFAARVNGAVHGEIIGPQRAANILWRAELIRRVVDRTTIRLLAGELPLRPDVTPSPDAELPRPVAESPELVLALA